MVLNISTGSRLAPESGLSTGEKDQWDFTLEMMYPTISVWLSIIVVEFNISKLYMNGKRNASLSNRLEKFAKMLSHWKY
jgi:hypothetical protein